MSQTSQRPKKSRTRRRPAIDLSQHVEIDLAGVRRDRDFFARKQVLSMIEAVEYRKRQVRRLFTAADQ